MGIGMWRHREVDNPHIQGRLPCRTTQLHRPMQGRRDHPGGWQSTWVTHPGSPSPTPPPPRRPLACSALPRSHAPASPWTTSTSSIAAPTTRPWLYARTPRAAPRVASRILHASRPFVD
ncbi:Pectin lyase-like superfamily protein [Zea mays]|uniref:Pectin lyase-like superfamily protein n=1 Tax=Zea mays TaxID=4577 RepID=A0A1D6LRH2_MAIZE|nr:Pectin lyase-like superfamily protein [Zea mays]